MRDIAVVMLTVDRSPQPNYLRETLANLSRSEVWQSPRLHSFHLVDSGQQTAIRPWPDRALDDYAFAETAGVFEPGPIYIHRTDIRRNSKQNKIAAFEIGGSAGAPWMLLLEDDIDVCADFLGSVGRWLDEHSPAEPMSVHPFAAAQAEVARQAKMGASTWKYAASGFWGLQACAFRAEAALAVATWIREHPFYRHRNGMMDPLATDLEVGHWYAETGHPHFLAAVPSFVQHIGAQSFVEPGRDWQVTFASWPGRDWQYGLVRQ